MLDLHERDRRQAMPEREFRSETPAMLERAAQVERQSIDSPKVSKTPPHTRIDTVDVGDSTIGRTRLEPGWTWAKDIKPVAGTKTCELLHRIFMVSGRLHIRMQDGSEFDLGPGDAAFIPPGHDAWVVGDEAVVNVSFSHARRADMSEDKSKD